MATGSGQDGRRGGDRRKRDRRRDSDHASRRPRDERRKNNRRRSPRRTSDRTASERAPRPRRWDVPFGVMSDVDVDRVLSIRPFCDIDASHFPSSVPFREIIRNDTRITSLKNGDIVVREGDYGNSAFFILSGRVRIVISPQIPAAVLGRAVTKRKGLFGAMSQLWRNASNPEVRAVVSLQGGDARIGRRHGDSADARVFLQDVASILSKHETLQLYSGQAKEGDLFGEIAALGRTPRTATVFSEGEAELLEIRWQGLRDIKRRSDALREHIDRMYRERSLKVQMRATPIFSHLDDSASRDVADHTIFQTFGNFDWYASYKSVAEASSAVRLEHEPIIAEEGHYPNGVYIIRAGFARLSQRYGNGHRTVSYLGRGRTFGFEEIAHNWRTGEQVPFQYSLRAIGYVDILLAPTSVVEKHVLPTLPENLLPEPIEAPGPYAGSGIGGGGRDPADHIGADLLEFLTETRFINGTATMVINTDRCTRCDDCVRACAGAHDNNPRFIRHGLQHRNLMVANACMHCADPVCMIGCPTGAIHREQLDGQVVINDQTCIGCSTCANNCPYHNIRMVDIRDKSGQFILDEHSNTPIQQATKCDLCVDQPGGPACQRACPHDAMRRIDMSSLPTLAEWLKR